MKKQDKQFVQAMENRFHWACKLADELFPTNSYQHNCLDHEGEVVTVIRVSRYSKESVGCFKLPDISNFIPKWQ